jgi:hypothetical protein
VPGGSSCRERAGERADILAGETDDVVIIADGLTPGLAPVNFVHDGDGNFAMWAYGTYSPRSPTAPAAGSNTCCTGPAGDGDTKPDHAPATTADDKPPCRDHELRWPH